MMRGQSITGALQRREGADGREAGIGILAGGEGGSDGSDSSGGAGSRATATYNHMGDEEYGMR